MKRIVRVMQSDFTPVCSMYIGKKPNAIEVVQKRAHRFDSYEQAIEHIVAMDPRAARKSYRDRKYKVCKLVTRKEVRAQTIASIVAKFDDWYQTTKHYDHGYRKAVCDARVIVQRMVA